MNELYSKLINNKIIENIVNNYYTLSNEQLIEKVMPYIDSKYKNPIMNKDNSKLYLVKTENNFNVKYEEIKINKEKKIFFYTGFILVSEEIIKSLAKEFYFRYNNNLCECLFGENKIFIKIINYSQNIIEMGSISNEQNIFIPKFFFSYINKSDIDNSLSELLRVGFMHYKNNNLLFNNDFYTPIFDAKGNIIGDAIAYNYKIKDYSKFQINEQLKSMIKLYFNYSQLRYSGKEIKPGEYYLFNVEFLKKYKMLYNYEIITDIDVLKEYNNIKNIFNEKGEINEKELTIIIKNKLYELNKVLNEQEISNKIQNINDGEPYYNIDNSSQLMY